MARLVLLLVVVGVGIWLYKNSAGGLLGSRGPEAGSQPAPVDRARAAAARIESRQAETDRLAAEGESPREGGRVHENMTPSEVRALLGPPDEVTSETTEAGAPREVWIYRGAGKRVVFENGVAVSVR